MENTIVAAPKTMNITKLYLRWKLSSGSTFPCAFVLSSGSFISSSNFATHHRSSQAPTHSIGQYGIDVLCGTAGNSHTEALLCIIGTSNPYDEHVVWCGFTARGREIMFHNRFIERNKRGEGQQMILQLGRKLHDLCEVGKENGIQRTRPKIKGNGCFYCSPNKKQSFPSWAEELCW